MENAFIRVGWKGKKLTDPIINAHVLALLK